MKTFTTTSQSQYMIWFIYITMIECTMDKGVYYPEMVNPAEDYQMRWVFQN